MSRVAPQLPANTHLNGSNKQPVAHLAAAAEEPLEHRLGHMWGEVADIQVAGVGARRLAVPAPVQAVQYKTADRPHTRCQAAKG